MTRTSNGGPASPVYPADDAAHASSNRRLGLILFGVFAVLTALAALFIAMRPGR